MNTHVDVDKLVQQTQRYEFSDGLRDFQLGLMMAASGIMTWFIFDHANIWLSIMVELGKRFGTLGRTTTMIIVLIPSLLTLAALLVMRVLRRRWLWRNTGYVKSKQIVVPFHISLISVIVMLVPLGIGMLLQTAQLVDDLFLLRVIFIASGWSLGYTLIAMGQRLDLPRYIQVGLWTSLLTTIFLLLPLTVGQTALLWGLAWAATLTLSGINPLRDAARRADEVSHER
ncbi:MAG: hypothetical protein KF716_11710 [Anaerolineae bacterium]|nr:hypothetical protein [Anaerolineae bacterium]